MCGEETTLAEVAEAAERNSHTLVAMTIYHQLVRYGWVSYDSAANAMGRDADVSILSGLLTGLQRAGLIERAPETPAAVRVAAFIAGSKPCSVFCAGPLFPRATEEEGDGFSG